MNLNKYNRSIRTHTEPFTSTSSFVRSVTNNTNHGTTSLVTFPRSVIKLRGVFTCHQTRQKVPSITLAFRVNSDGENIRLIIDDKSCGKYPTKNCSVPAVLTLRQQAPFQQHLCSRSRTSNNTVVHVTLTSPLIFRTAEPLQLSAMITN